MQKHRKAVPHPDGVAGGKDNAQFALKLAVPAKPGIPGPNSHFPLDPNRAKAKK